MNTFKLKTNERKKSWRDSWSCDVTIRPVFADLSALQPRVNIQSVSGETRYAVGIQRKAVFDDSLFCRFMCNLNSICAWNQKQTYKNRSVLR